MPHLTTLTGLRFVAALLVVMFHFLDLRPSATAGPLHAVSQAAHNVIARGFSGVSFFFILSGFILAYNYLTPRGEMRVSRRATPVTSCREGMFNFSTTSAIASSRFSFRIALAISAGCAGSNP